MATMQDVMEEFYPYYCVHCTNSQVADQDFPLSEQASCAYEDLQKGETERAKKILEMWLQKTRQELPADWEPAPMLLETNITIEDVRQAQNQQEARCLNFARQSQLLRVLS